MFGKDYVVKLYFCHHCKRYYIDGGQQAKCAVLHDVGDCCHYGDRIVDVIVADRIKELTKVSEIQFK